MSDSDKQTGANAPHTDRAVEYDMDALDESTRSRLALSMLMDGEAGDQTARPDLTESADSAEGHGEDFSSTTAGAATHVLDDCHASSELTRAWQGYHLVRSVMRKDYCGAEVNGLAERVSIAIAKEPALAAALAPRGDASANAAGGARRGNRARNWQAASSKHPRAGIPTGHRPTASARVHPVRHTAAAVATGAVLGVAVWLAIQSGLGDGSDQIADGIAVESAAPGSEQVALTQAPPAPVAALPDPQPSANTVALAEATTGTPATFDTTGGFDMTPQRHRRMSDFVVQHAEFQGGAGYPVVPYVVLVGGAAQ